MNKKLKIALGITVGLGVIYLGYRYFYKKDKSLGTDDTSKESIVHSKENREVVLIEKI
jgi:hypothetical protein